MGRDGGLAERTVRRPRKSLAKFLGMPRRMKRQKVTQLGPRPKMTLEQRRGRYTSKGVQRRERGDT